VLPGRRRPRLGGGLLLSIDRLLKQPIAVCRSSRFWSAFGNAMVQSAASRSVAYRGCQARRRSQVPKRRMSNHGGCLSLDHCAFSSGWVSALRGRSSPSKMEGSFVGVSRFGPSGLAIARLRRLTPIMAAQGSGREPCSDIPKRADHRRSRRRCSSSGRSIGRSPKVGF